MGRLNAFRLNVAEQWIATYINGQPAALRIDGATISHALNEQVDTANFRTRSLTPVAGQTITVYQSDITNPNNQLFGGRIIETTALYEKKPANVAYDIRCIDPTWLVNRRRVLALYVNQSATAIAIDIATRFCRGLTTRNVATGLAVLEAITFSNEAPAECFTAICQRIGASWYVDYAGDLHLFINEDVTAKPITDAQPYGSAEHQITEDLSQVVTRVIGRGGGVGAAIDLAAGATEIPVEAGDITAPGASWYAPTGGLVEINAQRVQYAGLRGQGGTGAMVGVGNSPSSAPSIYQYGGTPVLTTGATYKYAVTFVTGQGETVPGPMGAGMPSGAIPPVPTSCTMRDSTIPAGTPGPVVGGVYHFFAIFSFDGGSKSWNGPLAGPMTYNGKYWQIWCGDTLLSPQGFTYLSGFSSSPPPARYRQVWLYRTLANGATYYSCGFVDVPQNPIYGSPGWLTLTYNPPDGDIAYPYNLRPPEGPPFSNLVASQIPVSSSTLITQRKVYRTTANGSQLKLVGTINNNTDTIFYDTTADASLGVNAPTADTSGLTDNRQVPAGVTELPVSATGPFETDGGTSGGWARVGSIVVRYTGIGTGQLTGLPATGAGSLSATVRYGTQVLVQPRLVGVPASGTGALLQPIRKGDTLTIRLERQDDPAALAMANRFGSSNVEDGIIEEIISDSRFGLTELLNQMLAMLSERKDPSRTVTFTTRDASYEVGRTVAINISTPPISGTFRIQRITFSEIAITGLRGAVPPLRRVEATNKLFTFADFLRQLRGREGGVP